MRSKLSLLTSVGFAAFTSSSHATTLTYTDRVIGSGTLDGKSFTDALVTFAATGSTTAVAVIGSADLSNLPTTVTVAGLGTDRFTDTIAVVANHNFSDSGFGDQTTDYGILFTSNPFFNTYDLGTATIPLSGSNGYNAGHAFATVCGTFTFESLNGNSTFQAVPISVATTPEPSTALLLATGALGFAGTLRRRLSGL